MADDRMNRIERENAEALHFLTTPVRWFLTSLKIVFMIVVLVMLLLVNQVGWITNIGPRSRRARDARQNRLEAQLAPSPGGPWSVFDVDFRTQPDPTDHLSREDRFWDDSRPLYAGQMEEDVNWRTKAFTTTWLYGWGGNPGEGIPYCTVLMHPGRAATFYDASPGSWATRSNDALDRKSARMQRDYEIAAMMTASLRSTLAHMKLHRPMSEVFDHHAYCDADSAMHTDPKDPRYGMKGLLDYITVLMNINLQHAPVVRFRYVGIDPGSADTDAAHSINLTEVWGMCIPAVCAGGLGRGTTYKDDLFATQAPLTDDQMLAENAIMAMTTEAFWEQAARENGISDSATVAVAWRKAIRDLNDEFLTADFQM
jgi:hypothetical protein